MNFCIILVEYQQDCESQVFLYFDFLLIPGINFDTGKESMHLTQDALKNPCLDYVEHIIFSVPNASFEAQVCRFWP